MNLIASGSERSDTCCLGTTKHLTLNSRHTVIVFSSHQHCVSSSFCVECKGEVNQSEVVRKKLVVYSHPHVDAQSTFCYYNIYPDFKGTSQGLLRDQQIRTFR